MLGMPIKCVRVVFQSHIWLVRNMNKVSIERVPLTAPTFWWFFLKYS